MKNYFIPEFTSETALESDSVLLLVVAAHAFCVNLTKLPLMPGTCTADWCRSWNLLTKLITDSIEKKRALLVYG